MNKSSSWYNIHGKNSTVWARFIIVLTSYHNLDCTTCNVAPTRCYFSISYANLSNTMSYSDEHWSHCTCASNTCQGYIISVTSDNFIFFQAFMVWRFSSRFPPLVEERQGSSSPEILIARQQLKSTYQDDYYTRKRGVCVCELLCNPGHLLACAATALPQATRTKLYHQPSICTAQVLCLSHTPGSHSVWQCAVRGSPENSFHQEGEPMHCKNRLVVSTTEWLPWLHGLLW